MKRKHWLAVNKKIPENEWTSAMEKLVFFFYHNDLVHIILEQSNFDSVKWNLIKGRSLLEKRLYFSRYRLIIKKKLDKNRT